MTTIKICGITNVDDARGALAAGADLLGFILYPKSPRYIEPGAVAVVLTALRDDRAKRQRPLRTVGVFVNEPLARVQAILGETGLDLAQLHGDEPAGMVTALAGRAFKAIRPPDAEQARAEAAQMAPLGPDAGPAWLMDAYDPAAYGGTGRRADWHVAGELARRYPGLLLAGGLTPENVAAAVAAVQPWGVDVSSGVEASPGRKDPAKVRAFVAAVRPSA